MRFFKGFLEFLSWLLIALTVVAIFLSISMAIKSPFFHDHLYGDFARFIEIFEPFSILLGAIIIVVAAAYLLGQIASIKQSNLNFVESTERIRWIAFITPHLETIQDYYDLRTDLLKKLPAIHDHLFKMKYAIKDGNELREIFDLFFRAKVKKYEQNNVLWTEIKCYPDEDYSYSFQSFRSIFMLMIDDEKSYAAIEDDLKTLYMAEVKQFSKDLIATEEYAEAIAAYNKNENHRALLIDAKKEPMVAPLRKVR